MHKQNHCDNHEGGKQSGAGVCGPSRGRRLLAKEEIMKSNRGREKLYKSHSKYTREAAATQALREAAPVSYHKQSSQQSSTRSPDHERVSVHSRGREP